MSEVGVGIGITVGVLAFAGVITAIVACTKCFKCVQEKEVIIIERCGKYKTTLVPGIHCIVPFCDAPRTYTHRFFMTRQNGSVELVNRANQEKVSTQNEVLDFPAQTVITRDNACVSLDAILQYRVTNPMKMMYTTTNLPLVLSKILQAAMRNVAGMLDVDQIIEDTAALDRVSGQIDAVAARWGVRVEMVKVQRVEAGPLKAVLEKKKNADLTNKEMIIQAKAKKQTTVIESEGHRDRMIREAEGNAAQTISVARGQAQAIINDATAEAANIKEIAASVKAFGENPTQYLLAVKYIDALKQICQMKKTEIRFMPSQLAYVQTVQQLGVNTIMPPTLKR